MIITAGGTPIKLGMPGEIEYAGKGVSYCAICDGAFFRKQTIAVVGGGDAATEEADFLTRYADKVYLIHRRDELRASKILQQRLFANPKVEVIWNTVVDEVQADEQGLVNNLRLRDVTTEVTRDLAATGMFVFVGFRPNTGIVAEHVEHDDMGYFRDRREHGDERARAVRRGRRAFAADAAGDDGRRRRDDRGDRGREVSQGARGRPSERADRRHGRLHGVKILAATVGEFQENTYLVIDEATRRAVVVDPGAEPDRVVEWIRASGATLDAVWLTHAHLDHVGAVAGVHAGVAGAGLHASGRRPDAGAGAAGGRAVRCRVRDAAGAGSRARRGRFALRRRAARSR